MSHALAGSMSYLSITGSCRLHSNRGTPSFGFSSTLRGQALHINLSTQRSAIGRSSFVVEAKQNAKQRERLSEAHRVYNRARKSAVATRIKKVFKAISDFNGKLESEEALKPVEKMISEAYQEIDKAVQRGVLHINTGARRKSRLAQAKKKLLITAGLYNGSA
ncbi:probable 30S ribosomal protein S20 [Coccomyxa sp. Obi]|nr:probable 30S ribosomal protein S20 [Coccomyxa sp. Obi]